jgi:hypothetical protein
MNEQKQCIEKMAMMLNQCIWCLTDCWHWLRLTNDDSRQNNKKTDLFDHWSRVSKLTKLKKCYTDL